MEVEDTSNATLSSSPVDSSRENLRDNMIQHLIKNKDIYFKSQQLGEPELDESEKRKILEDILNRSSSLFLSKFGNYLSLNHLEFFHDPPENEKYEVEFYLGQLKETLKKEASEMCIKNRRFDALKKLITEGSYFSEDEMRKRNPLLYEQLVGRFLSDEERRMQEEIDTSSITLVNLLLEQIERESLKKLQKAQEEDEDAVIEEEDTSDEDEEEEKTNKPQAPSNRAKEVLSINDKALWGEMSSTKEEDPIGKASWIRTSCEVSFRPSSSTDISDEEKRLLLEEFRTHMYSSFLQGKDSDCDYSKIDSNPEHDDLEILNQDAEDKYFDSESPEAGSTKNMDIDSEEDEFEKFMARIKTEEKTDQITSSIKHLNSH